MLIAKYFEAMKGKIDEIEKVESGNIAHAAEICVESIAHGGVVHIHDTGHMLNTELIHRAGGLVGMSPFSFAMNVNNLNIFREKTPSQTDTMAETIALALKRSNVRAGDVMFVGSVSGKSAQVVETAIQAKAFGVTVIALTSIEYSSQLESEHSSGMHLYEVADLALDNHAPYGDSMLAVEGLDVKACPASGINAACIMWAVVAGIIEALIAKGLQPTVYMSANAPGGMADVEVRKQRYKEKGY